MMHENPASKDFIALIISLVCPYNAYFWHRKNDKLPSITWV